MIFLKYLESSLIKINDLKDEVLFIFIKPYWPRSITPNHITYVRVGIGVLFFILLFFLKIENKSLIVGLFIIGALTDFLDGPVARGTNKVTAFGAMLDPAADRILILPIAVYSLSAWHPGLLITLAAIEIINALFSLSYPTKKTPAEANIFGKTSIFLMCLFFIAALYTFPFDPHPFFIIILWFSIPFSCLNVLSKIGELKKKTR